MTLSKLMGILPSGQNVRIYTKHGPHIYQGADPPDTLLEHCVVEIRPDIDDRFIDIEIDRIDVPVTERVIMEGAILTLSQLAKRNHLPTCISLQGLARILGVEI